MRRHLVVLGTVHSLQGAPNRDGNIDDPSYRVLIEHLIEEYTVDYIFEEASQVGPTTAEKLAHTSGINYRDVDQHAKCRPPSEGDYDIDPTGQNVPCPGDVRVIYLDAQVNREELWAAEIKAKSFGSGLMICGFSHTLSVARRFEVSEFKVMAFTYFPCRKLANAWLEDTEQAY